MKLGVQPDRVLLPMLNDRMVAKGLILQYATAFFSDFLHSESIDDLVALLRKVPPASGFQGFYRFFSSAMLSCNSIDDLVALLRKVPPAPACLSFAAMPRREPCRRSSSRRCAIHAAGERLLSMLLSMLLCGQGSGCGSSGKHIM